jgi:RHS repeat-associated protein
MQPVPTLMKKHLQKRNFSLPLSLMKSKNCFPNAGFLAAIFICVALSFATQGFAQDDGGIEKTENLVIANTTYFPTATALANSASVSVAYLYEPTEIPGTRKIKNIITLSLHEEIPEYVPADFSASVTVQIEYGASASPTNPIKTQTLTVNYKKGSGEKYDAKNYFHFDNAQYVKITVTNIDAPVLAGFDTQKMLVLQNEMRVTRYYQLAANVQIQNLSSVQPLTGADELAVSWDMPQNIGHTHTQLEWTWIEDDFLAEYNDVNGNPDYNLMFSNNATRVDLTLNHITYKIPLLYGGPGRLYYRIRAVNIQQDSRTDGAWAAPQYQAFGGHNQALNWQSSASYAEEGKRKVVVQYFDGSLRSRQTVTRDNSTNTVVTAETFYDGQGRPAIQILPAPGITGTNNIIAYAKNLNLFNGQLPDEDPAKYFDLQPIGSSSSATPALDPSFGTANYYSTSNIEKSNGANKNIPDAEGYPYTVTRYTPDATGRIMSQSGVGPAMQMGNGHETKYYYGGAAQEELDGLFGTEVGDFTHYFKNMLKDANGQMSVSYVDMHGRTIATALAGTAPTNMADVFNPSLYPNQAGTEITRDLLNGNTNVVKGNSVESVNTLLVAAPTSYQFKYKLTAEALPLTANNAPVCYDCMYNLEISIRDESGELDPIVRKYNNINISADDNCGTAIQQFKDEANNPIANNEIIFTENLAEGSYIVRKTLTISETSLEKYKQEYIAKALVQTETELITSIYNEMLTTATCDDPPVEACASCNAALGNFETYRDSYLLTAPGTPLSEIQENYDEEKLNCERLCNTTSQVIHTRRELMIADMMAYSGQYSRELEEGETAGSMYTQYNIPPATNTAGNDPELAEGLLSQHPEYARLLYAETAPMKNVYNWITTLNNTSTYADAVTKGYISDPTLSDPFYTLAPAYKPAMVAKMNNYVQNLTIWQMAYGNALCRTIVDPIQREACYKDPSHSSPPYSNLTTEEKDKVWNAFKSLYAAERNNQVNDHIAVTHPLPNAQALIDEGYILHFPNNNKQLTEQYSNNSESGTDWNWYPDPPGTEPDLTDFPGGGTAADVYTGRCDSNIEQWKQILLECPALAAHSNKDAIVTQITNALKSICIQASNEANPYGASNLPDGTTANGEYQSFEAAINDILLDNGIQRSNVCNPFVIEAPKPYSSGSALTKEYAVVLEKCNCDRLSELKTAAVAAQVDPNNFTAFNQYLSDTYGETLTQELYDAMVQNCALMGTTVCAVVNTQGACIDRVCANAGNHFTLADPQPMPAFLKCGFTDRIRCLDCAGLSNYITLLKNDFLNTPYIPEPRFTGADLTIKNIQDNILFAQFVNYRTGFQYLWIDYAKKASEAQTECNLDNYAANTTVTQTVICRDTKPLNDPADFIITEDPCADVMNMAIVKAQHIMKLRRQAMLEDFEKLYRAKCMLTNGIEEFTVTYTPKEYHYTLYYYDMSGNLVKTVPPAGVRPDFSKTYTDQVKSDRAAGIFNNRPHVLITQYRYNSLGQVVAQNSPDANTSKFWYDKLGRLVVSQNAQQVIPFSTGGEGQGMRYSYTLYDDLGRIKEVGQKPQSIVMTQTISQDKDPAISLKDWIITQGGTREQITFTVYDLPYLDDPQHDPALYPLLTQQNLRNRVSYTGNIKLATDPFPQQHTATFYTYDIHGNVDILLQDYKGIAEMAGTENRFNRIIYDYDLISGKVNAVNYQAPFYNSSNNSWTINKDAFYHKYSYDAENRLTEVYTSRDRIVWERDAAYQYYKHGPLSRTEYGQQRTQGIDYAYTLQGWLKGVNSTAISATSLDCPEGTVLAAVLNVTGRAQYSQPPIYTASQEINFEPGFESVSNDLFETEINPGGTVCTPGHGNENIAYTQGDMGRDGDPTDLINDKVARDAFGFALNYFNNDYKAIAPGVQTFADGMHNLPQLDNDGVVTGAQLFNGNIASMLVNIPKLGIAGNGNSGTNPILYGYRYDQLNRIVGMNAYKNNPGNTQPNTFSPVVMPDYKERISYDPNGNILSYHRNGTSAPPVQGTGTGGTAMDQLTYKYLYAKTDNTKGEFIPGQPVTDPLFDHYTNQLASVQDAIGDNNYTIDIDAQDAFNYEYDKIGNLVKDVKEGITNVSWTVYGKINSITKVKDGATTTINYTYDASGNRISKTAIPPQGAAKTTLYVRDASGNTMSVYEKETAGAIKQTEIHLYGSSRIGMVTEPSKPAIPDADLNNAYLSTFTRSEKIFELCNHLQNVLVTISDKKIGVDNNNDGNVDYYNADVITANDFYPFGSLMPGRKYSQSNSTYRYGFNGKENDNEVKGEGNQIDYGMRIYDPRLGRFLSVDPLNRSFPYFSPYHFAGCSPIKFVDMDGGEPQDYVDKWEPRPIGHAKTSQLVGNGENNSRIFVNDPLIGWVSVQLIYDKTTNQNWFVHHNNSGKNYYYQRDDGQHDKLLLQVPKNGISTITGGSLTEFETQDAAQARIGGEVATGMATFWSVTLGGTLAGGGNFVYGVVMGLLEDALGVPILNSPDDFARSRKSAVDGLNLKKKLASEQQMSEVGDIIAGGTHQKPLRKASDLAKEYGGDPADWVKKRSSSYTAEDGTQFETHWEENLKTGQRVNMKSTEIKTVSTQSPEENPTKRPYDN